MTKIHTIITISHLLKLANQHVQVMIQFDMIFRYISETERSHEAARLDII